VSLSPQVVTVLVQQAVGGLLTLAFGALALAVSRRVRAMGLDRAWGAWRCTAAGFLLLGVYGAVHASGSVAAVVAGEGSAFYRVFVEWTAAGNIAREAGVLAYAALLAAYLSLPPARAAAVAGGAMAGIAGTMALATLAGHAIPGTHHFAHLATLAVLSTLTVVVLLAAMLVGLANDGLDQLHWLALTAYAVKLTLEVSQFSILAWWATRPAPWVIQTLYATNTTASVAMIVLGARRLRWAARGRPVPALFERVHALRRTAAGDSRMA
jgi:hypothetical protein